jgi:fatty-acid desaturase
MESFPHFAIGVLATFVLAIFLVLCSASALQAWSGLHYRHQRAMSVETGPAIAGTEHPASSYWSGRL